jgi:hypothetical protein
VFAEVVVVVVVGRVVIAWHARAVRLVRWSMAVRSDCAKTDSRVGRMDHQRPDSLAGHKDYLQQELSVNGHCDHSRPGSFGLRPVGRRRDSEAEISLAIVATEGGGLPRGLVRISGPTRRQSARARIETVAFTMVT